MTPRALIIAGVPRSGTTLLHRICNSHPQVKLTVELGNYLFVDKPFSTYAKGVAWRIWRIRGRWPIARSGGQAANRRFGALHQAAFALSNLAFATSHLLRVARSGTDRVTLAEIAAASGTKAHDTRIVGDKLPQYIDRIHKLVEQPDLLRLVIYRDCRDVASSYLRKVRGDWKRQAWIRNSDTAEKIARKWVRLIQVMERDADRLFLVRYEDLVTNPKFELQRLGEWLGVDPSGFDTKMVFGSSIGNYRRGLSPQELGDVLREAGPTLERLGYLQDEPVIG